MASSNIHVGTNQPAGPLKQGMVWIQPATYDGPQSAVVWTSMGWKSCPVPNLDDKSSSSSQSNAVKFMDTVIESGPLTQEQAHKLVTEFHSTYPAFKQMHAAFKIVVASKVQEGLVDHLTPDTDILGNKAPGELVFIDPTGKTTKGLGPTPFCENPKCAHSKTMVPADAGESWKAKKIPAEPGVAACPDSIANPMKFTIGRFEVVRDYGGMTIRSYFCEVCYEAIKTVEGL